MFTSSTSEVPFAGIPFSTTSWPTTETSRIQFPPGSGPAQPSTRLHSDDQHYVADHIHYSGHRGAVLGAMRGLNTVAQYRTENFRFTHQDHSLLNPLERKSGQAHATRGTPLTTVGLLERRSVQTGVGAPFPNGYAHTETIQDARYSPLHSPSKATHMNERLELGIARPTWENLSASRHQGRRFVPFRSLFSQE